VFGIEHLNQLRLAELDLIRQRLPLQGCLLEIGAGTGLQGMTLRNFGYDVQMVDLPSSNYAAERLCDITNYDGRKIPFYDATFDVVYSSNVLEHVVELPLLLAEIRRVLRPNGYAIHVVPTHYWRFWTSLCEFPTAAQRACYLLKYLLKPLRSSLAAPDVTPTWVAVARCMARPFALRRHGERGTALSELLLFQPVYWRRTFTNNGYRVLHESPGRLFYTGTMLMGRRLSIAQRRKLSRVLGSATQLFVVSPAS
jgi:SAM-dependent methyltransferase